MAQVLSQDELEKLITLIDGGVHHPQKTSQLKAKENANSSKESNKPLSDDEFNALMSGVPDEQPTESDYVKKLETNRKLAKTNPDEYLPELLMTLFELANLQNNAGRCTEAEGTFTEALEIYRKMAETKGYIPGLIATLNSLAEIKEKLLKLNEAENIYAELIKIRRKQAETNPDYLQSLAFALENIIRIQEKMLKTEEAEALKKKLAEINKWVEKKSKP